VIAGADRVSKASIGSICRGREHSRVPIAAAAICHVAFLAIRAALIGCVSLLASDAREGYSGRVRATVAALAGTVIQCISSPSIGNGLFLAEALSSEDDCRNCQSSSSVAQRPTWRRMSRWVPITFAQGMNFTPCAFPAVTEATELYCFSTPARPEGEGGWAGTRQAVRPA
jgi:hypothetical protein